MSSKGGCVDLAGAIRRFVVPALAALLATLVVLSIVLAALLIAPSAAAASDECDFVQAPAAMFAAGDAAGTFTVTSDLDALTKGVVERQRAVALFMAADEGLAASTVADITAYFDSVTAWLTYLESPCADAATYPGPFTAVPTTPAAPYGFGGVDATTAVEPMVLRFTDEAPPSNGDTGDSNDDGDTGDEQTVAVLFAADEDRPALAHSGSESFVLAYFGVGLLAFGATALGMRRWMGGPDSGRPNSGRPNSGRPDPGGPAERR